MKLLVGLAIVFVSVAVNSKDYAVDGKACAQLLNQSERLACFDKLFPFSNNKFKEYPKNWSLSFRKNEMTDDRDVFITKKSKNLVKNRFGSKETRATLILRCMEGKKEFVVSFDTYLDARNVKVQTRIDDGAVHDGKWATSTDGTAFLTDHQSFLNTFMPSLYGHKNLMFKVFPFGSLPFIVKFDITNIEQAYKPIYDACYK